MLKTLLRLFLALLLAGLAYLFYQAHRSETVVPATLSASGAAPAEVLTIAFGSCNRQDRPQGYWDVIRSHHPAAWLWLGDNVYADTDNLRKMAADYQQQKTAPEYAAFRAEVPQVYGIWDDHDYGINDGGREWPHKDSAKQLLLDFLDVPANAAVRTHPGTYQAYTINQGERSVKVILLDTRYFRDALAPATKQGHRYGQDPDGDILGAEQWAWLEQQLRNSTADAHLIVSSIQVLPQDHGYEKWDLFPTARQRLLDLLASTQPRLPLLLSGDRHLGEISRVEHQGMTIYEVTASGLTHAYENADEANGHRQGPLVNVKNYGLLHFLPAGDGWSVLAEIRTIEGDAVANAVALDSSLQAQDVASLSQFVHPAGALPTSLQPCPASPNCVSTQSTQADKKREPLAFTGTTAAAQARIKSIVDALPRTTLQQEAPGYLHYTFRAVGIPFIDDVEFLFDEATQQIHYRSASRVGYSDLGANNRRMAKIVAAYGQQ
ncbi:DUF1499 domain-containing protein [Neolewinella lacunae]|uniref:DUF1499 domain-containing protein n=1 Tax=Neolewinella lacunae TaxID=1517758 RepID=A0A923T8S0_9BACT|nr:DUF1499 domain-containing protein [Neolewinella lacunae]MBC6994826.1 DUF1499 domain-containing protein [Neolewinella lacunae]MDN3634448.1 DUF1499 domain-containing protein [Neolewinella lacunae]